METDEFEEYQQNEIDGAKEDLETRRDHLTGPFGSGLLDGKHLNEHQNDRAEAYLEGYADALEYALEQAKGIDNMARYLPDENDNNRGGDDGE